MAGRRDMPWSTIEELIDLLVKEQSFLAAEIEALRQGANNGASGNRAAAIVCQYLVLGNAKNAADWANNLGWRLPPIVPKRNAVAVERKWTADHVFALLDDPSPGLSIDLVRLARKLMNRTNGE